MTVIFLCMKNIWLSSNDGCSNGDCHHTRVEEEEGRDIAVAVAVPVVAHCPCCLGDNDNKDIDKSTASAATLLLLLLLVTMLSLPISSPWLSSLTAVATSVASWRGVKKGGEGRGGC